MQRSRPHRSSYVETTNVGSSSEPSSRKHAPPEARTRHGGVLPPINDLLENVVIPTINNSMPTLTGGTRESRCREPHQRSQAMYKARYRAKQEQLKKNLEECNQKLQQEVWGLEFRRYAALLATPTDRTVWTVALEYFRLFRYGHSNTSGTSGITTEICISKFLNTTMATDVTDGSICGPEAHLNHWKLFSRYFDDILLEVERLEKGAVADTLLATTTLSITISKNTLRLAFPHLIVDEHVGTSGSEVSLAAKLINQRLVMRGVVLFQWNAVTKRVVRIQSQADMLTAILPVVGSLENVSRVFEGALVTPDCNLIPELSDDYRHWVELLC